MLTIDGSQGEGGGQVLRSCLALSLVTGRPFRIENLRARRKKPGLKRQHKTAVEAAATIGAAEFQGAELGSQTLSFIPHEIGAGDYHFSIGTAGSTTLVLQAVLPALLCAPGPSTVTLDGGTHNPLAPPFEFLAHSFLPLVERMGPKVEVTLQRAGFFPAGGGRMSVRVAPPAIWKRLHLSQDGPSRATSATAIVARLPRHIAQRELDLIGEKLDLPQERLTIEEITDSAGPGNVVMVEVAGGDVTEWFAGFGQRGVRAETVATRLAREVRQFLKAGAPVGQHLADQLLIPMALAGGGSFFTGQPTSHLTTNLLIVQRFLDVQITSEPVSKLVWKVVVEKTK